jgi:hypothetical protein
MRKLTFTGFLNQYVRYLSSNHTTNLFKLCKEADTGNSRLKEPLFLYAVFSNKMHVLLRAAKDYSFFQEYVDLVNTYSANELKASVLDKTSSLPVRYTKVYQSYLATLSHKDRNKRVKPLMRNKILELQTKKNVSNYRLYTDLHLNPGNINDFLKNGTYSNVSLDTVRVVLDYLENK